MASYRKRHGKWQVQVRSTEYGSTTKTFYKKTDAKKWAVEQEMLMQTNQWFRGNIKGLTLGDLIHKYKLLLFLLISTVQNYFSSIERLP